jgi:Dyp-type peroxidase family
MKRWVLANEPQLRSDRIQGNILAGFLTDKQLLVGYRILNAQLAGPWLGGLADQVTVVDDVPAQGRMRERAVASPQPGSVWLNVALSHAALRALGAPSEFRDDSFKHGLVKRANDLGDPPSDPAQWRAGGTGPHQIDMLLILAGDEASMSERADELSATAIGAGLQESYRELGSTVPDRGIEHFGFRDGISQPGILGTRSDGSPLTAREIPDSGGVPEARPGEPLIWPGQFIFGYPCQSFAAARFPGPTAVAGRDDQTTGFAQDGSLLVFRRLRQDVPMFKAFLEEKTAALRERGFADLDETRLSAMLVGRWPSGAPLSLSPAIDDPSLARDRLRVNAFDFEGDSDGAACPLAAHIRKANPRDGRSDLANPLQTRILRRGVPYGPFVQEGKPEPVDRGLLFLCYQTSIVDQFEFLMQFWINSPKAPSGGGNDMLIGQPGGEGRTIQLLKPDARETVPLTATTQWITPTGGEYLFAPSKPALSSLAG